jgi:putative exporter of polyketide antibiotics
MPAAYLLPAARAVKGQVVFGRRASAGHARRHRGGLPRLGARLALQDDLQCVGVGGVGEHFVVSLPVHRVGSYAAWLGRAAAALQRRRARRADPAAARNRAADRTGRLDRDAQGPRHRIIATRESRAPRLWLLSSPSAHALRSERSSLAVWLGSIGAFAILGVVSSSVSGAGISKSIEREIAKFGAGSVLTPKGYLSLIFIFFVLAVSLFACAQVGAARQEEAEERLETMLALPIGRRRSLGGRLLLAVAAVALLSLAAGAFTWAGAATQGVSIPLPEMLEAGANCMPVALLFLGAATLAYAAVPRASAGIAYGLVTVAFLWELIGPLLSVPKWVLELTPFAQVGLVPVGSFKTEAALVMLAIGALAGVAALALSRRRDLLGR